MNLCADDVIRAGACAEGVHDWMREHANGRTVVPVDVVIRLSPDDVGWVSSALGVLQGLDPGNGYGEGNGYVNGSGYGNGYGDGDGYGYGDGDGYGYGNGYGEEIDP